LDTSQTTTTGHLQGERLPGGAVEGRRHPFQCGQHEDVPGLDAPAPDQRRKREGAAFRLLSLKGSSCSVAEIAGDCRVLLSW